jgi:RNA polymerase sigma-70 factor (ECF subfamily)
MTDSAKAGDERSRRFRDAVFPYIDDAYTLAHFLMHSQADAEDAVQECYSCALRGFDSFRGPAIKTWLLAILRSLCHAKLARRSRQKTSTELSDHDHVAELPLPRLPEAPPDSVMLGRQDGPDIRRLVIALPMPFREAIVLHEFNGMSYREVAEVVDVPVGTVMSRLARARAMLLVSWMASDSSARWRPTIPAREAMQIRECAEFTVISD